MTRPRPECPDRRRRCTAHSATLRRPTARKEPPWPTNILTLSDATFDETVGGADTPVARRLLGRVVRAVQDDRPGARGDRRPSTTASSPIAKLNVDDNPDTARRFDVMSIPTLLVFQDGEPVKRLVGAKGKGQLLQDLAEFIG